MSCSPGNDLAGDVWEEAFETKIKGLGTLKGWVTYTYETDDKVGLRKTVRMGIKTDVTVNFRRSCRIDQAASLRSPLPA